jgi:hypothetical protein
MSASRPERYCRLAIAGCFAGWAASREISEGGWRSKDTEKGRFWSGGEEEGVALVGGRRHPDREAILATIHARRQEKLG